MENYERIVKLHPGRSGEIDNTAHRRNQRIEIVFSPEELEILDEKILATDFRTRSKYIRKIVLLNDVKSEEHLEEIQLEIYQLIAEFKKIGNNINQIAKKCNQEKKSIEFEILMELKTNLDKFLAEKLDEVKTKIKK
jgi:hypothetical protein